MQAVGWKTVTAKRRGRGRGRRKPPPVLVPLMPYHGIRHMHRRLSPRHLVSSDSDLVCLEMTAS